MPSANFIMKNWLVDCTWTPTPGGTQPRTHATGPWAPVTVALRFKAHATNQAYVTQMALSQTQDMDAIANVTLSAPYLDTDQSW